MGHKDDDTFMAYISIVSGVDVQNIINQHAPDQPLIDYLRLMQPHIDLSAPVRASSHLTNASRRNHLDQDYSASRESHFGKPSDIFYSTDTTEPFTTPVKRLESSRFLLSYLRHDKDRAALIHLLQHTRREELVELSNLVHPLRAMCASTHQPLHYPSVVHTDG
jgi:hypothetical protein